MSIQNNFIEIKKRRTFAIVSHPDAGKTTLTEQFLFLGKIIRNVGIIKSKRSGRHVKSDWMKIEQERGISITSSVIQFSYKNYLINLLDTPGHEDFSEDTYRILTAVDFCLMVIDSAKGIEFRTKKLIEVIKLHNIPIFTFVNKLDRESKDPIKLLDELELQLKISCVPITWPIGFGSLFQGIYHIYDHTIDIFQWNKNNHCTNNQIIKFNDLYDKSLDNCIGKDYVKKLREEVKLILEYYYRFDNDMFINSNITPVFFGCALRNIGVNDMFNFLLKRGPFPRFKRCNTRMIYPEENCFSGFVFKIQANMDLKHRDRIAFIRIISGRYYRGIKLKHVRMKKTLIINNAIRFLAGDRNIIKDAYPGDIIGIYNHGSIVIGDTFTEGENIHFIDLPILSPEMFRVIYLKNPLQKKQLSKGLIQLSEEGAVQIFYPIINNNLIIGVLGILQFDIIKERLKIEYRIDAFYKDINVVAVRWVFCNNLIHLNEFKNKNKDNLALDNSNFLTYIAPSFVNLNLVISNYPNIIFSKTREN